MKKTPQELLTLVRQMPLVAILRGLDPAQAADVGVALVEAGFKTIEVPLNRPGALKCIDILVRTLPSDVLVGGGTMLTLADVDAVHAAGGRLMVAPNLDLQVLAYAKEAGMLCAPGVVTPSEAFAALKGGAHALKLFPADTVSHAGLKALKSVLPLDTDLWPVGGITPDNMGAWAQAGATGFGIGGQLFAPGCTPAQVLERGLAYVQAWRQTGRTG